MITFGKKLFSDNFMSKFGLNSNDFVLKSFPDIKCSIEWNYWKIHYNWSQKRENIGFIARFESVFPLILSKTDSPQYCTHRFIRSCILGLSHRPIDTVFSTEISALL